jgi:hypothetical protein
VIKTTKTTRSLPENKLQTLLFKSERSRAKLKSIASEESLLFMTLTGKVHMADEEATQEPVDKQDIFSNGT